MVIIRYEKGNEMGVQKISEPRKVRIFGDGRPVCPDCEEVMVKAYEQDEEGRWGVRWLCGCEVPEGIYAEIERMVTG